MKSIFEGLSLFQRLASPRHKELFDRLAKNQTTQAVFVACSDTRLDEKGSPDERHVLASVESAEEFWERL